LTQQQIHRQDNTANKRVSERVEQLTPIYIHSPQNGQKKQDGMCMITDHRNTRELLTGALEALHRANAGATNNLTEAGILVSTGKIGIGSMSAQRRVLQKCTKKRREESSK
jgi:hypothetical protein